MTITIKYYGMLAEITQCQEETIAFQPNTVEALLDDVYKKYPKLKEIEFKIAQNNTIIPNNSLLIQNELALLPPFAGG